MDEKIEKLKALCDNLREERQNLNDKTKSFLDKNKNKFNALFLIKSDINKILDKNKEFIDKIKKLKQERNLLNNRVLEINKEIAKLRIKSDNQQIYKNDKIGNIVDLKNKMSKLEWFIQTEHISLKKEDELQDELSNLKKMFEIKTEQLKNIKKSKRLKTKKIELKKQADEKHRELMQYSDKSDKHYAILTDLKKQKKKEAEKIKLLIDELNILRTNADNAHQKYIDVVKTLKEKIKKTQMQEQKENIKKTIEQSNKAYKSFLAGKKLSLGDLMLIENKIDKNLPNQKK